MLEAEMPYALVVKGLSRLPVTEEIAGSNPVERAMKLYYSIGIPMLFISCTARWGCTIDENAEQLSSLKEFTDHFERLLSQ